MDFLDWFTDTWNRINESVYEGLKMAVVIVVAILSSPVWILPFVYWFIFVRRKDGDNDG